MAEVLSLTLAKLEQLRVEHTAVLNAILLEIKGTRAEQREILNYQIDILRDIRLGLSMALGEDLSNYSESGNESTT